MGLISLPTTFVDGTVPTAAQFNGDFTTIANEFNGSISNANISASAAIAYSKLNLTGGIVAADLSDAAVTSRKLKIQYETAQLTGSTFTQVTSGATWYNVTDMTKSFTPAVASVVEITVQGVVYSSGAAGRVDFAIDLDGVRVTTSLAIMASANQRFPIVLHYIGTVTAAAHTAKVVISDQVAAGNTVAFVGDSYNFMTVKYWSQ